MSSWKVRQWTFFLLVILLVVKTNASETQSNTMVLKKDTVNNFSNIQYQIIDLDFNGITQQSQGWKSSRSTLFDEGFSSEVYWFKQTLINHTENSEWYLTLNNTRLDYVDFYFVSSKGLQHLSSGDYRPISGQLSSYPTFQFTLRAQQTGQLYIRVQSETIVSFLPAIRGSFTYGQYSSEIKIMHVFYAIILLVFIAFQIAMNYRITDKITLYYAAALCFGFAYNLFYFGEGNLIFWPDNSAIKNRSHYIFALLCCTFFSLFLQKYVRSAIVMPRFHHLINAYLMFVFMSIIITLFPVSNQIRAVLVLTAAGGVALLATFATFRAIQRDSYWALWLGSPLIFTMLATLVYVCTFLGVLPYTSATSTMLLWSFLFDVILISLSLMFRHYALRHERDELLIKLEKIALRQRDIDNEISVIDSSSEEATRQESKNRLSNINPHNTIMKLLAYLDKEQAFLEPCLNVENVASMIHVRPDQLSALISSELNTSFPTLINIKRLEAAASLLKEKPDKQILNVALECGFNSKSNFNRLFKEYFDTTPSLYRKLFNQ
ncbi:7TM-DISM domain-containing protein [Paraglaciecola sp.]|uniref:7TM-DISM domain-containing protein n=1 Tax=Paraglaciecola sp. TaxID=1920173 RepID=UPI0032665951